MSPLINTLITALIAGGFTYFFTIEKVKRCNKSDIRGFIGGWIGIIEPGIHEDKIRIENIKHIWGYYGRFLNDISENKTIKAKSIIKKISIETDNNNLKSHLESLLIVYK